VLRAVWRVRTHEVLGQDIYLLFMALRIHSCAFDLISFRDSNFADRKCRRN
jgi:hypothetical protein